MGKDSGIEWTHHTHNLWWGCVKVGQGCAHCYAETWSKRSGKNYWGPNTPRRFFKDEHYEQPLDWDRAAARAGERHRVFCGSMMDLFEKHTNVYRPDLKTLTVNDRMMLKRMELWSIISRTPNLDWLLLTKRLENVLEMVPPQWKRTWPSNVWLGFSASNQEEFGANMTLARLILDRLLIIPPVLFVSLEPLIGPVTISEAALSQLDWVIVGGESGRGARAMHPDWARTLRDECTAANVPFFFKQWGSRTSPQPLPWEQAGYDFSQRKGGAVLDGVEWQQFPEVQYA